MKSLHKIKNIKRDEWIMSFTVLWKKYSEEIDYSLIDWDQIGQILNTEVYCDQDSNYYITNK